MHPLPTQEASLRIRDYAFALAAVAGALFLRYLLNPILGQQGPYLILTLPIVLTALYGGFWPAIFAAILGTSVGTYLFIGRGADLSSLLEPANVGRTALFLLIGFSIAVIGGRLRRSQQALATSVEQLRASNKAKDSAMTTLGHEIRNPLAAIHMAQELLQKVPDDAQRVLRTSELIARQVAQMKRMADDMVDLSGVMKGEFRVEKRRVELQQVLTQAMKQVGPLIAKKGHQLQTEWGPAPIYVLGDQARLVQVFANLLNNAAKYTHRLGTIGLTVNAVEGRRVAIRVRDSGVGMDPGSIDDLFEPFVQAPGAASNAEGGVGLGLALVKQLVQAHAGVVEGHSEGIGRGSTFTVILPLASPLGNVDVKA